MASPPPTLLETATSMASMLFGISGFFVNATLYLSSTAAAIGIVMLAVYTTFRLLGNDMKWGDENFVISLFLSAMFGTMGHAVLFGIMMDNVTLGFPDALPHVLVQWGVIVVGFFGFAWSVGLVIAGIVRLVSGSSATVEKEEVKTVDKKSEEDAVLVERPNPDQKAKAQ